MESVVVLLGVVAIARVGHLYLRLIKPRMHNSTSTSIHCYKYWFMQ